MSEARKAEQIVDRGTEFAIMAHEYRAEPDKVVGGRTGYQWFLYYSRCARDEADFQIAERSKA